MYVVLCHCLRPAAHLVHWQSSLMISDDQILSLTSHLVSPLSPLTTSQLSADWLSYFLPSSIEFCHLPALTAIRPLKAPDWAHFLCFPPSWARADQANVWCWPCIGCKSPRCHQVLRSLRGLSQYGEVRISGYTTTVYNHHNRHTGNITQQHSYIELTSQPHSQPLWPPQ